MHFVYYISWKIFEISFVHVYYNENTDLSFWDTILCYTILLLLKKLLVRKYLENNHTHDAFNSYNS